MGSHGMLLRWNRNGAVFRDNRYSRAHIWQFDGGAIVPASSSPDVVRVPFSDPSGVDPEEAFIAAIASCHMLWFLSLAAKAGYVVDEYRDAPVGTMGKNAAGDVAMLRVDLQPRAAFVGAPAPDPATLARLHHEAHAACFIANSVNTVITVTPS